MTDDRQIYILRTSNDIFNKFFINNNNLVLEEIKNGEVVKQKIVADNIKSYSVAIDTKDRMHVIYTDDNINLKYKVLPHMDNSINIISAKSEFILRCLSIKTLDSTPHIFCAFTDMKRNEYIIYHNYLTKAGWQSIDIFKVIGSKYMQPYLVETNLNDIYILLCSDQNGGKFSLYKFVSLKNQWINLEDKLYLENCSNIYFFISSKNIAIIAYNKLINKNLQTIMMFKNLKSNTYECWRTMILSDKDINTLKPSIFSNEEEFYITWIQGSKVLLKRSNNLTSWEDVHISDINSNDYTKCFYMSNNIQDFGIKANNIHLLSFIKSDLFINLCSKKHLLKEYLALDHGQSHVNFIESKLQLQDKRIQEKIIENSSMENQIKILNGIIHRYENQLERFIKSELSLNKEPNYQANNFIDEMVALKEEKDKEILLLNKKLSEMLRIVKEKDNLINELYKRIDK